MVSRPVTWLRAKTKRGSQAGTLAASMASPPAFRKPRRDSSLYSWHAWQSCWFMALTSRDWRSIPLEARGPHGQAEGLFDLGLGGHGGGGDGLQVGEDRGLVGRVHGAVEK